MPASLIVGDSAASRKPLREAWADRHGPVTARFTDRTTAMYAAAMAAVESATSERPTVVMFDSDATYKLDGIAIRRMQAHRFVRACLELPTVDTGDSGTILPCTGRAISTFISDLSMQSTKRKRKRKETKRAAGSSRRR